MLERAALKDELARIADLEAKLGIPTGSDPSGAAPTADAILAKPALTPSSTQPPQAQTPQDWSTRVGNLENRLKSFGPFSLSGDIRLRDEPFFGGPANQSQDRNRERYRLRFNINAKLNDDISGGFTLASGDVNDPTTTNQTVTDFYARKPIAIDKAYVNYTPHQFRNLTLIGGKFGYPWYNTELTWDKDLNPEGLAQVLAFNLSTPVLKKIAFVGFELPFARSRRSFGQQSEHRSERHVRRPDTDAMAVHSVAEIRSLFGILQLPPCRPDRTGSGQSEREESPDAADRALPLGTGNTVQNSIVTTTATNVVTVGGTSYPTGVTSVTNAQFASKFALFDSLARFDIKTPADKWPIAFIGDYVQNTEACANENNILAAPANTASIHYAQSTNFACNARQRRGYWAEAQVGRGQKKGDWQFDYTRIFTEREAVLSNFAYSDIRQGSNVSEHRAMVIYQFENNVQLSFTGLFGRPLNFGSTKPPENWLKRLQFDVIYSF